GTYLWLAVISTLARLFVYAVTIAALPRAPGRTWVPAWLYAAGLSGIALCIWGAAQASSEAWTMLAALSAVGVILYAVAAKGSVSFTDAAKVSSIQPPPSSRDPS
ncbi:MAG TPA: hypothetical protein VM760_08580, partial [Sphingomicrobium sp.]|nr:hypothetical protein [Sphingomicrobium sp.]